MAFIGIAAALYLVVVVFVWALCVAAGRADEEMSRWE
jgi:hypothetical protein